MQSRKGNQNRWAIILAGGEGTRLSDLSGRIAGEKTPKQYCQIVGDQSLIDQTRLRVELAIRKDRILYALSRSHGRYYTPLLHDVLPPRLVVQPLNRGTAPAVLYSLMRLGLADPNAHVALFPCDHYVSDDNLFMRYVDLAFEAIDDRPELIVVLGITPNAPELKGRHYVVSVAQPMYTPKKYAVALLMMLVSMLCWGSWANTEKIDKAWRFELYYWDYMWGILACALLFGLTLGRTNPAAQLSFFHNLDRASSRSLIEAFVGGMIFNLGNLLLVAAISVAGMSVAFPLGAGLALVIGAVLNYIVSPTGNPLLLFGGILLICLAIAANAMAYRGLSKGPKARTKGIVLSLLWGVVIGLFYPFVAKAMVGENHLGPYTVYFIFALGALASNFPLNYGLMRRPVSGSQLSIRDYFQGGPAPHTWGVLGGLIWGTGTVCSFVAAYTPIVGPATSFSLGEGNAMISALWGVFVWKEFRGAGNKVRRLLALMFGLFVLGLVSISLAPVFP